eukprot:GHVT01012475.1.p1 GENE.GHVT01012475.1~~GHVT01012475.1.p1  ORF type:complete len:105 (-),score=6.46 GHVT01012475.1:42-356(-)
MDSTDEIAQDLTAATLRSASSDSATESAEDGLAPQAVVDRPCPEVSPGITDMVIVPERRTGTMVPLRSKSSSNMVRSLQQVARPSRMLLGTYETRRGSLGSKRG